jgi:hypothetical protein
LKGVKNMLLCIKFKETLIAIHFYEFGKYETSHIFTIKHIITK